jgi:hypothetical protein
VRDPRLEALFRDAPAATQVWDPARAMGLPEAVRRYLGHTLAPGTPLARAARIEMHGEIELGEAWSAFHATQVLRWDRGFVWHAHTTVNGLPVSGADREVDGVGQMKWKLLGIVPVMTASGPDISRSAIGRLHAEAIWLPGALLDPTVVWSEDADGPVMTIDAHGEKTIVHLSIAPSGALRSMKLGRWGDVDGGTYHYVDFGGAMTDEVAFGGVTLPTRYRIGWFFGSERFEKDGEFFRCTLDRVEHR